MARGHGDDRPADAPRARLIGTRDRYVPQPVRPVSSTHRHVPHPPLRVRQLPLQHW
jgi:hypothetical protein